MSLTGIITNIAVIIGTIGAIALLKYTGALDVMLHGFDWVKTTFSWLMENRLFAAMTFIFLIGIAGAIVSFVLGLHYACASDDTLRTQRYGVVGGVAMLVGSASNQLNASDPSYDTYIGNWTVEAQQYSESGERGIMRVECRGQDPKLTTFGVDFLDYRYWLLIMLITGVVGIAAWARD
jgi:hypothetical protein